MGIWTAKDRADWHRFKFQHPTLGESILTVKRVDGKRQWSVTLGDPDHTRIHALGGETRTDLQRRVMRKHS